jgi:phenylacetic acid degradation operon negative regulatory protein
VNGDAPGHPIALDGTGRPLGDLGLRPLTARSVILSVLLGSHPPLLPVRSLVRTAALFGINEGTTRVALSRLVGEGDVVADGRRYRLSDRLIDRQRRQDESRAPATRPWRGRWELALIDPALAGPAERARLGAELTGQRLGELRGGVWLRPANLRRPWPPPLGGQAWCFEASEVGGDGDGRQLAARVWDLSGWAERAEALLQAWAAAGQPAARFMLAAAIVRHLQTDPLLPAALLPPRWPGTRLRDAYADYERELGELLHRQRARPD